MVECVPVITGNHNQCIAFSVTLIDTDDSSNNIRITDGNGIVVQGKKVGKASVVLKMTGLDKMVVGKTLYLTKKDPSAMTPEERENWYFSKAIVKFFSAYRDDEKELDKETENSIIEACKIALKAYWG